MIAFELPDLIAGFAAAYLDGLLTRLLAIQENYRQSRSVFDALFRHRRLVAGKNIALRWAAVLHRLDTTDFQAFVKLVRAHLDPQTKTARIAPRRRTVPTARCR